MQEVSENMVKIRLIEIDKLASIKYAQYRMKRPNPKIKGKDKIHLFESKQVEKYLFCNKEVEKPNIDNTLLEKIDKLKDRLVSLFTWHNNCIYEKNRITSSPDAFFVSCDDNGMIPIELKYSSIGNQEYLNPTTHENQILRHMYVSECNKLIFISINGNGEGDIKIYLCNV